jgi:hypothetical protein
MGWWKASKSHKSKGKTSRIGSRHFDVYHTNKAGKRDQSHSKDFKISGDPHSSSMKDVHGPKK